MSSRATATTTPTAAPRTATPPAAQAQGVSVPRDRIAVRAYEKWLKRGCKDGHDQQDWIEAEKELRAEMSKTTTRH